MIRVYGNSMCPDCRNCALNLDRHGIAYESVDIMASLPALKAFLKLRDTDPVFDRMKAAGDICIPAIVKEDGTVTVDWEGFLREQGLDIVCEAGGQACGLDRKNC